MCLNCRIIKHRAHSSLAGTLVVIEGMHIMGRDKQEQYQAAFSAEVSVFLGCWFGSLSFLPGYQVQNKHLDQGCKGTLGLYYNVHMKRILHTHFTKQEEPLKSRWWIKCTPWVNLSLVRAYSKGYLFTYLFNNANRPIQSKWTLEEIYPSPKMCTKNVYG